MSVVNRWMRQLCADYLSLNRSLCSSASLLKKEESAPKKEWYVPVVEREKESWNAPHDPDHIRNRMPEAEWKGVFQTLAPRKLISPDFINYMQKGIDLRPSTIKKWWGNLQNQAAAEDQAFKPDRVAVLGFDLGAAHFLVHRGMKIRFKDATEWVQQDEDGVYDLPRHYQPDMYVEEIDASGMNLVYEGLESMKNLKYLKSLSLAGCPHIDDWCLDRICGEYCDSLEHLNISGCTRVTHRGVLVLVRLRHLRTLDLHGLENLKDIKFICLLLQNNLPELKISGISYLPQIS